MDEENKTCCFTGHRPAKLPWGYNETDPQCLAMCEELRARLEEAYLSGYRHFLCGMALGCDMLFAEAVLSLRARHPDVFLEAVVPCADQPNRWTRPQRQRYNRILDSSNKVTILQVAYTPDCMLRRNRHMIGRSSLLIACYNGQPGGTRSTMQYAMRAGLTVLTVEI